MEITEKERLMLVEYQKQICNTSMELLDLTNDIEKNTLEIKKKISLMLSLINTIAGYSNIKNCNVDGFREVANDLCRNFSFPSNQTKLIKKIDSSYWKKDITVSLELFCNYANSIRLDFTNKKALKVTFPKNLNLGYITNR